MKNLLLILRNLVLWKEYNLRVIKKLPRVDFNRGCGYYISVWSFSGSPLSRHAADEFKMESGKIGIYKLLNYKLFSDPHDMVKESQWQFLGYKGEKPIADMSFKEFLDFRKANL